MTGNFIHIFQAVDGAQAIYLNRVSNGRTSRAVTIDGKRIVTVASDCLGWFQAIHCDPNFLEALNEAVEENDQKKIKTLCDAAIAATGGLNAIKTKKPLDSRVREFVTQRVL